MTDLASGRKPSLETRITRTLIDEARPLTEAQFEQAMGLMLDRVAAICDAKNEAIEAAIARGVQDGLRAAMNDQALVTSFWATGFDELATHSGNHASQWIGKRLLTSLIVAITIAGITWLVQTGRFK